MSLARLTLCSICLLLAAAPAASQDADGRLYGRITTHDGDTFEGLIRWDKNEVSWLDILDGSKRMRRAQRGGDGRVRIFGIEFDWKDDNSYTTRESGIRFGHIARLEAVDRNTARLTLRSGQEVELTGGSTDIGTDIREIIIEDRTRGTIELDWRDLELVEFKSAPARITSRFGERLYGTLRTRRGDTFTGYVCWDIDEVLAEDILDGDDDRGRDREIRFGNVARIERESSSSSHIFLKNGEDIVLRGSNDVNSENRGILILDPYLGQVRVDWREFDSLEFQEAPRNYASYNTFGGGGPLYGTVFTYDGNEYTGRIRWDDDEAYGWELLDGEANDVSFDIEFAQIREIVQRSSRTATATLRDGRSFELRGSNDVNDENNGIYVTLKNGEEVRVGWFDFKRVVFDKP